MLNERGYRLLSKYPLDVVRLVLFILAEGDPIRPVIVHHSALKGLEVSTPEYLDRVLSMLVEDGLFEWGPDAYSKYEGRRFLCIRLRESVILTKRDLWKRRRTILQRNERLELIADDKFLDVTQETSEHQESSGNQSEANELDLVGSILQKE